MTIKELIKVLRKLPQDAEVVTRRAAYSDEEVDTEPTPTVRDEDVSPDGKTTVEL